MYIYIYIYIYIYLELHIKFYNKQQTCWQEGWFGINAPRGRTAFRRRGTLIPNQPSLQVGMFYFYPILDLSSIVFRG